MQSSIASNDGNWHHYAGTWDGTTFTRNLYVDGVLAATTTSPQTYTLAPNSELCIGDRDSGNHSYANSFTGGIYDVRIYNYPLAQSQVIIDGAVPVKLATAIVGSQLQITWPAGTLLEATNLSGPWTTNPAVSPALIDTTGPQRFFRVTVP
jgi:hypothetical protein